MPTFDYVTDDEFHTVWANPDVPGVQTILDADGQVVFDCPNQSCERELDIRLDEYDDVAYFIDDITDENDGTMRCPETHCTEPLYGIRGDHDGKRQSDHEGVTEGWEPGVLYE